MSPKPRIRYVFALVAPIIINFSEIFVYMYFSVFFYAVGKADFIRRAYVSARAVADKKLSFCTLPNSATLSLPFMGKAPLFFSNTQPSAAVCRKTGLFSHSACRFYYARILLLRKLAAADFTNQLIYNPTHFTAPFYFYVIISHTDCFVITLSSRREKFEFPRRVC